MKRVSMLAALALALPLSACTASSTAPVEPVQQQGSASLADDAASQAPDRTMLDRIVAELMQQQYGAIRDEAIGCTHYVWTQGDEQMRYCMQAAAPQVVRAGTAHELYLRTFNSMDAAGIDSYDAITPGLMGAFRVRIDPDGRWRVLEASRALAFGTMGSCGCDKAAFLKLGPQVYGWMFTSGGTWQGITVSNHEIVVPRNGGFVDVSAIPEIREQAQGVTYSVRVVEDAGQGFWPLDVTRASDGGAPATRRVAFDHAAAVYRLPDGF